MVARTRRLLALNADSDLWQVWIDGYRDISDLLERGDRPAAVERYRAIYQEYRPRVQALLADPTVGC